MKGHGLPPLRTVPYAARRRRHNPESEQAAERRQLKAVAAAFSMAITR